MPVDVKYQVPFLPSEGITGQILTAISLANEQHQRQQQLALQQQQLGLEQQAQPSVIAQREAQTKLAGAQTEETQQQVEALRFQMEMRKRESEYVFGAGAGGGQPTGQAGAAEQKPGLYQDMAETKKRLKLSDEESAQFDQALRNVQVGFLSKGQLDMTPVDKVIQDHMALQGKKDTDLHPTFRQLGNQWFQDMHTAEGKLAYSVPVPPPSEYLAHTTEGVDYMRTVDQQTGQVTITPITTQKVTKPIMPGQPTPKPIANAGPSGGAKPFQLTGAGKKLSEQGQAAITGLTQATGLTQPVIDFLSGPNKPSVLEWGTAVAKYKLGMDPGADFTNAFQAIGFMRAQATGPLLHGIRNRAIIKGIQEHLPDLTQSPSLVAQKIKDLQPFWKQAMDDVYKTENVAPPKAAGLSPEAAAYLKSQGITPP